VYRISVIGLRAYRIPNKIRKITSMGHDYYYEERAELAGLEGRGWG
jgi:hypothetical protein